MGRGFEPPTEREYNNGAAPSVANDWPAIFFAKKNPHQGIQYKRVRLLVFSSSEGTRWSGRCNLLRQKDTCVLINYPPGINWDGTSLALAYSNGR
jgi:hypothetical protein